MGTVRLRQIVSEALYSWMTERVPEDSSYSQLAESLNMGTRDMDFIARKIGMNDFNEISRTYSTPGQFLRENPQVVSIVMSINHRMSETHAKEAFSLCSL